MKGYELRSGRVKLDKIRLFGFAKTSKTHPFEAQVVLRNLEEEDGLETGDKGDENPI
jgi:hypothetical protein